MVGRGKDVLCVLPHQDDELALSTRIARELASGHRVLRRRLGGGEGVRHAALVRHYPSQWRTCLGLLPGFAWSRAACRRELLQPVDTGLLCRRPQPGPLLYERLFGFSYEAFQQAALRELGSRLD